MTNPGPEYSGPAQVGLGEAADRLMQASLVTQAQPDDVDVVTRRPTLLDRLDAVIGYDVADRTVRLQDQHVLFS